jgi:hypothetical protein
MPISAARASVPKLSAPGQAAVVWCDLDSDHVIENLD